MSKPPKKITVKWIMKELKAGKFPNMYPDKKFLSEHYKIVQPYKTELHELYKRNCYKELNTYYKTGEIILQGGCPPHLLDNVATAAKKTGLKPEDKIRLVADRLESLEYKVKALPHDVVVYRGVKRGTIGQNMFTGKCIKTRLYDLDMHRFCDDPDMEPIKLFKDYKPGQDARQYVYETLGFVSTSSKIGTALGFAQKGNEYDTVIALRMPKGTKFIMPVDESGYDYEYEFILFPKQSTFILEDLVEINYSGAKFPVYVGAICNSVNEYRPKGSPFLRPLKVKLLAPDKWQADAISKRPLLVTSAGKCKHSSCNDYLHFCDPETGKCIGDKKESEETIKKYWRKKNVKGKCDQKAVDKCVKEYKACDPNTAKCLGTADVGGIYWGYSDLVQKKVLDWVNPKIIIDNQKPRYKCTTEKIKKCAENSQLCEPFDYGDCTGYTEQKLWKVNNAVPLQEMKEEFVETGKCSEQSIKDCAKWGQFCDPNTNNCVDFNESNAEALQTLLAGQTDEKKAEKKKKKAAMIKKITTAQKPRYKCTAKKIEQCAEKGALCHPVHKYQDCKPTSDASFDEDVYFVNNVVDKAELKDMDPYGTCSEDKIGQCLSNNEFCDPNTGMCLEFNSTNDLGVQALNAEIKKQATAGGSKKKKLISEYLKMTVAQLKNELKARGLKVSGLKAELIQRLAEYESKKK